MFQNYTMQYWAYIGFDRRYTWVISPELFGKWAEKGRQRSWSQSSQSPERRVSHISSTYPKQLVCSLSFSCFFLRNTAPIALNYLLVFWRLQRTLLQSIKGRLREKCSTLGKVSWSLFTNDLARFPNWQEQVGHADIRIIRHMLDIAGYMRIMRILMRISASAWPSLVPTQPSHLKLSLELMESSDWRKSLFLFLQQKIAARNRDNWKIEKLW